MEPLNDTQVLGKGNTRTFPRARAFCFTLFNYEIEPPDLSIKCDYIIMGNEVCPKTKKQHWQSYIYFKNARTFNSVQKLLKKHFNQSPHIEPAKGSPQDNIKYCTKDNKYYEEGHRPCQGKRTDLDELRDEILCGKKTADDILREEPKTYHQYGRTIEKLEDSYLREQYRTEMTTCEWYYGPTGTGKSHKAFENFSPKTHYVFRKNDKGWWDGYRGQETVILNDFRGEIEYTSLLELIDKWAVYVPRRGRESMPFISKKIIVTSPWKPERCYAHVPLDDDLDQLFRRINTTLLLKQPQVS